MRLTVYSDYTLRVLMYLAINRDKLSTIPEIAAAYGISGNHLMKVVHQLGKSAMVESVRGKGGGIRLAMEPEEIRIGRVVREAEGEAPIVECFSAHNTCRIAPSCRLAKVLSDGFSALYASLDEYTLADLVVRPAAMSRQLRIQVA